MTCNSLKFHERFCPRIAPPPGLRPDKKPPPRREGAFFGPPAPLRDVINLQAPAGFVNQSPRL